ncbi:unnamed protein product [Symbiodinium sp. CCMP2592]|nr:unnamed protein product [Symbiodinium sp. CCMP2592]
MEVFMVEDLINIFRAGDSHHEFTTFFAAKFVTMMMEQGAVLEQMKKSEFAPIEAAVRKVERFMRALLYIFDQKVPAEDGSGNMVDAATAADVFAFTEARTSDVYGAAMQKVLVKTGSWYAAQTDEIARTAATRKIVAPKLEALQALLEESFSTGPAAFPTSKLQEVVVLHAEVRGGLRALEMQAMIEKMEKLVRNCAEYMMSQASLQSLETARVEALLALLDKLSDVAGIPSLLQSFQEWAAKTRSARNSHDLIDLMKAATREKIDVDAIKRLLPAEGSVIEGPGTEDLVSAASNCVHKLCLLCVDKAGRGVLAPCDEKDRLVADIRKELLLIIGVAKKLFGSPPGDDSEKAALNDSFRSLIMSYSHYLQAGFQQLERLRHFKGLGNDAETRMGHKNSPQLLSSLKHGADKVAAEMAKIRSTQKTLQSDDSDSQRESTIKNDEAVMAMVDLFVEDVFYLAESHMYQDCVAWLGASLQRDLQTKADDMARVAAGFQSGGEHDWKASLGDGASLDDIFTSCKSLLDSVDIRKLRQAGEDCGVLKAIKDHMDMYDSSELTTIQMSMLALKELRDDLLANGIRQGRTLGAEMLLLHQIRKIHALPVHERSDPISDLSKLVTKLSVFFTENIFQIEAGAVQRALWTESQKFVV